MENYNNNDLMKIVLDAFEKEATKENERFNGLLDDGVTHDESYLNNNNTYIYKKINHSPWMGTLTIPELNHGITIDNGNSNLKVYLNKGDKTVIIESNSLVIKDKKTESFKMITFNEKEKLMGYYHSDDEYGYVFKNNELYGVVPKDVVQELSTYENMDRLYKNYFVEAADARLIKFEEMAHLFDSTIGKDLEPYYLRYQLKLLPKINVTKFTNYFEVRRIITDVVGYVTTILTEFENVKTGKIVFKSDENKYQDDNNKGNIK